MSTQKKIGILGGTFDPIHSGHLIIAEVVREEYALHKVLFVPSANPPHKQNQHVLPARHRLEMVRLAIADNPSFELSDIEMKRDGRSYSVETLVALRKAETEPADYFFIIGADSVPELRTWKNIEQLARLCTFVVVPRPGWDMQHLTQQDLGLPQWLTHDLLAHTVHAPLIQISSTEIRDRIQAGKTIRYLVPRAVEEYIAEHRLYRTPFRSTSPYGKGE